jgi:hypothetical protein
MTMPMVLSITHRRIKAVDIVAVIRDENRTEIF